MLIWAYNPVPTLGATTKLPDLYSLFVFDIALKAFDLANAYPAPPEKFNGYLIPFWANSEVPNF